MKQTEINILYEDKHVIVADKPAGLLTVPGRGPDKQDCLINRLLPDYPNSRVVHRLDMATSGIVILPQSHHSQSELSKQFQQRHIKKRYQAVVDGVVEANSGIVDLPLICDWENRPRQKICHDQGKSAQTEFQVLQRNVASDTNTRIELRPITGRSHQLRVHMMALGHPILGDYFYASLEALKKSNRLLLHATEIQFQHPHTSEWLEINSPVPF